MQSTLGRCLRLVAAFAMLALAALPSTAAARPGDLVVADRTGDKGADKAKGCEKGKV
jgi:hypothetical protein